MSNECYSLNNNHDGNTSNSDPCLQLSRDNPEKYEKYSIFFLISQNGICPEGHAMTDDMWRLLCKLITKSEEKLDLINQTMRQPVDDVTLLSLSFGIGDYKCSDELFDLLVTSLNKSCIETVDFSEVDDRFTYAQIERLMDWANSNQINAITLDRFENFV